MPRAAKRTTATRSRGGALLRGVSLPDFEEHILGFDLSMAQRAILCAYDGLPMPDAAHAECFESMAGYPYRLRAHPGGCFMVAGARGGKSQRLGAAPLVHDAVTRDHARYLSRGERAAYVLIAQDLRGVRVDFQ